MRTGFVTIGIAAALSVAACAAPATDPAAGEPVPTVSTSAVEARAAEETAPDAVEAVPETADASPMTAEPAQMTIEQAGEYYLQWICWSNSALDQWSKLMGKTRGEDYTSKRIRDRAAKEAAIHLAVADALENPPAAWPADVAKDITKVAGAELNDVSAYGYWSKADTISEVSKAIADLQKAGGTQAAQRVRLRLNLPAAGGKKDGCWIRRNPDGIVPSPVPTPTEGDS